MADETALRAVVTADDTQYQAAMQRVTKSTADAARAMGGTGKAGADGLAAGLTKAERAANAAAIQALKLAAAQARVATVQAQAATASARAATAQQQLATATARTEAAQIRAAAAALRYAQAQEKASRPPQTNMASHFAQMQTSIGGVTGAISGMGQALQGVGLAVGAQQIAQFTGEAINSANQLRTVQNLTRMVAGDQATYNQILAAARDQQRLFGGSLKDNMSELSGFAVQARLSGASLTTLITTAQRLATFDPAQGITGASVALREALSGNINTLAMRFELPKDKIRELGDASLSAADRLKVINDVLTQAGIPANAAAEAVDRTTQTYNALGAAVDTATTNFGNFAAQGLEPAATGLTRVFGLINGNAGAIAELKALFGGGTVDVTGTQIDQVRQELERGLRQTEVRNADKGGIFGGSAEFDAVKQQYAELAAEAERLTAINEEVGNSVREAAAEYAQTGDLTAFGLKLQEIQGLQAMVNAGIPPYIAMRQQAAQADQQAASAATELDTSLQAQAAQALIASTNNEVLTIKKAELEQQARLAANAVLASGANIEAEAARLAASSSLVDQLTAAYLRLAMATGEAQRQANIQAGKERLANQAGQTRDLMAGGPGLGYNSPGRQGGGDVDAVIRTQQQVAAEQARGEAKRTAVARSGGAARVSEEQRAAEQLAQIAQQTADRLADIDRRMVETRAAALRQLASDILTSSADMVAQQEANDLELAGLDAQQLERFRAREQAEAESRARQRGIVQEAQQRAASGDAELAQKVYDIQSEANQARQELDESYYRRQAELAGNPEALAELQQQYNEAVAAQEQATAVRIQLAEEAAAQAKAKAAEERAAVIAEAEAQAAGVKGASDAQRAAVVANLSAEQQAAMAWAGAMEAAASRVQAAASRAAGAISSIPSPPTGGGSGTSTGGGGSGGGGATRAAGGGRFVTSGPTTLTVGDNPGGVELVTVTPLSGRGQTTVGGGMVRMAGGGEILVDNSATNPALRDRPAKKERDLARQRETDARRALAAMDKERAEKEKNLLLDIERERQRRTLKRALDAQEDAIDQRERAARKAAERQLDAQEEAQAAELARRETARRTGAVDQQEQAEQLRARQAYEAEARRIVEQTGKDATSAQQFWARAQLADLQANLQAQQATIRESYAQQREQAVEGVEAWAQEQLAAEFDARRELLNSTIEAAYQPERDALDDLSRYRLGMLDYELSRLKQASFSAGSLGANNAGVSQLGPPPIPSGGGGFFAAPTGGGTGGDTILQMGPISIPAGSGVTAAQVEQIVRRVFAEMIRQTGTSLIGR